MRGKMLTPDSCPRPIHRGLSSKIDPEKNGGETPIKISQFAKNLTWHGTETTQPLQMGDEGRRHFDTTQTPKTTSKPKDPPKGLHKPKLRLQCQNLQEEMDTRTSQ